MSATRLFPEETIRQVTVANEITEVVSSYLTLKKMGATYTALCPVHLEKSPSFTVTPSRQSFKCFGCGVSGDVLAFISLAEGISFPEAVRRLAHRAGIPIADEEGGNGVIQRDTSSKPGMGFVKAAPERALPPERHPRLPSDLRPGRLEELRAVAAMRGLSVAGLELASERGLLWFGTPKGFPAWIITDRARVNAQARRQDGQTWEHIGGAKAWTLPGSRAAWPIGVQEAESAPFVVVVEGGPDALAAHHFIVAEGREADTAVVSILGATVHIPDDAIFVLTHKRVRLFPHADPPGQEAAVRWAKQLEDVGCVVDAFRFEGLRRSDGAPVNDLNDLACLDADCFEAERENLEEVLPR